MSTHIPGLYIGQSAERGRGVFTAEPIAAGDVIEICHVIVVPPQDLEKIHTTHLHDYYFLWGEKMDHGAIALGYGSLYNHAQDPNAEYELDLEDQVITIICIKAIQPGEEITLDYQPDPDYKGKLWFELK